MATQTQSALEAANLLFEEMLPNLPIADLSFIEEEFKHYADSWQSPELIKGNKKELYERVLANLERSVREPGFQFFVVDLKPAYKVAQAITFSNGDGASVCLFRTSNSLYICGNYFFK